MFEPVVAGSGWNAFGDIAAEADLQRMQSWWAVRGYHASATLGRYAPGLSGQGRHDEH